MFDGDTPKSEEERLEEIKFEIKNLFDDSELKITDPTLAEQLDQQKQIIIDLLSQTDEMESIPKEATKELSQYFRLLEVEESQFKDPIEQSLAQIKVAVSHAKTYYDLGKTKIAFDLLDDPEEGAIVLVDNMSSWSEEHNQMHKDISRLSDLLYELLK